MSELKTFINKEYRPDISGGSLDLNHVSHLKLSNSLEDITKIEVNAICFGPKKDNVLLNLEHAIHTEDKILVFYYEDIHVRWTYLTQNGCAYIIYKKNDVVEYKVLAKNIYIRGCYVDPESKLCELISNFLNFIELWDGKILCSPKSQLTNESKLFQLNNSLLKSSEKYSGISIGDSFVIKGLKSFERLSDSKEGDYIVKSLSGIRSEVVDGNTYKNWDKNSVENIPVLFQKKAEGNDLRVHIIDKCIHSKYSESKDSIDYRYDKAFYNLIDIEKLDDDMTNFCLEVSDREANRFLGIDFIKEESRYVVLEANPSPGWSAYYPHDGMAIGPLLQTLLQVLKSE